MILSPARFSYIYNLAKYFYDVDLLVMIEEREIGIRINHARVIDDVMF